MKSKGNRSMINYKGAEHLLIYNCSLINTVKVQMRQIVQQSQPVRDTFRYQNAT